MKDLTVIYLTANQQPEHFAQYQRKNMFEAIGNYPLITVTRKPLGLRGIEILDTEPKSHLNMYKQMLKAAKMATTPYIAAAEDDALYHSSHFTKFRPPLDTFSYNMARWALFTWSDPPTYNLKNRISNCVFLGPRELFIEAWEERLAKFPGDTMPIQRISEVGRNNHERWLKITVRKCVHFYSDVPIIHINHVLGTDSVGLKKRMGKIRAFDIPHWGRAEDLIQIYNGTNDPKQK